MNGLIPFERAIDQTTETIRHLLAPKQQQPLAIKRVTSLGELPHFSVPLNKLTAGRKFISSEHFVNRYKKSNPFSFCTFYNDDCV